MSCGNCASCSCSKDDVKIYSVTEMIGNVSLVRTISSTACSSEDFIPLIEAVERIVSTAWQQNDADNH